MGEALPSPVGTAVDSSTSGPLHTTSARLRQRPLSDVVLEGGLWLQLQQLNREVTLREAFRQLEDAGNLHNFRVAAGDVDGEYRGKLYLDSDVYKTLEAVAWEQGRMPSDELAAWQDTTTALIARAQRPDGYLNTFVQITRQDRGRYADLPFGHELFCGGHLIQAGVAQARGTGRTELLDVARRYADHLTATFGPGRLESTDGHPEIEMALVELYRTTGTVTYLDLARFLVDVRGRGVLGDAGFGSAYFQDEQPVRRSRRVRGHAVRQVFLSAGSTDLYLETGDEELLDASIAQWEDMVAAKTYLTGGIGARWEGEAFGNAFELPPDTAYAETCAAHGSILWTWRLLLATGDARYADLIERTLYNGFFSGLSLDGSRFFYVNALQCRPGSAEDSTRSPHHGRQPWYGTACCPPNVMRTLASLHHYVATSDDEGIQLHQYVTATLSATTGSETLSLSTKTDLPWDGVVEIEVLDAPTDEYALSLRIPGWAVGARVSVNEVAIEDAVRAGTYLRLNRRWARGDLVRMELPCTPRLTVPDRRIDALRSTVAIERGPLLYAVEQTDLMDDVDLDAVELVTTGALREHFDPDLLGGVVVITAQARSRPAPATPSGLLPYATAHPAANTDFPPQTHDLRAVPYFRWANRVLGPMRVFLPIDSTTAPAQEIS